MSSSGTAERRRNATGGENQPAEGQTQEDGGRENGNQQQQQSKWSSFQQMATRFLVFYFLMQFFQARKSVPPPDSAVQVSSDMLAEGSDGIPISSPMRRPAMVQPLWFADTPMDLFVYISEDEEFTRFNDSKALAWEARDIRFGDWKDERKVSFDIAPSKHIQNNGTLYAHIYLTKQPTVLDPSQPDFDVDKRVYNRKALTRHIKKKKEFKGKRLLGGNDEEEEETDIHDNANGTVIISHWHQNLTINVVHDRGILPIGSLPPPMQALFQLESTGARDPTTGNGYYLPVLYPNDFWQLREHMYPVNDTVTTLPLTIYYYPLSFTKLQMYAMMDINLKQQAEMMGTGSELDEFKRMLIETNPYLLATTAVVSLLHSVFEFLAFKNDIAFWKDKKDAAGLSVRTIFLDIFQQVVVFLYLLDNSQETSYMILFGQGIGLIIEVWKIKKALKIDIVRQEGRLIPYRLHFNDTENLTDLEEKTKEYDEEAFKYLSWVAFPLLGCYALYSLLYQEHKSWYSFILTTLVGFVYTFGFIKMTPQLFINYKLKSVAHMPFRTMMYKSLNTFIDDLFSFIIKMPMMHRLACLRDDVVFFVYLYQRHVYKVDPTRANEFGQRMSPAEEEAEKKKIAEAEEKKKK